MMATGCSWHQWQPAPVATSTHVNQHKCQPSRFQWELPVRNHCKQQHPICHQPPRPLVIPPDVPCPSRTVVGCFRKVHFPSGNRQQLLATSICTLGLARRSQQQCHWCRYPMMPCHACLANGALQLATHHYDRCCTVSQLNFD